MAIGNPITRLPLQHFPTIPTNSDSESPFFFAMAATSFISLIFGLEMLEKTGLSNSISPTVMTFFQYCLAITASHSSAYALLFRPPFNNSIQRQRHFLFLGLPVAALVLHLFNPIPAEWYIFVYFAIDLLYLVYNRDFQELGWHCNLYFYWNVQSIMFSFGYRMKFSPDLVVVISVVTAAASSDIEHLLTVLCSLDEGIKKMLPLVAARGKELFQAWAEKKKKKIGKFVKYAFTLGGTVLFQNFFRLTTFNHVKAFLYLAVSWIANLALINASGDFGILNFLLGNMIAGSAVNQFGLGSTTWISCGACLCLYVLSLKVKSTCFEAGKFREPALLLMIIACYDIFIPVYYCHFDNGCVSFEFSSP